MKLSLKLNKTAVGLFLFLLLSQAVFAQDFSSLDQDLAKVEDLLNDMIISTEEQLRSLESLNRNLQESGSLITHYENTIIEQEKLLTALQTQLTEMSETFRMQSALSAKSEKRSKFWRTFTIIAIPATAVISGSIVYAAVK